MFNLIINLVEPLCLPKDLELLIIRDKDYYLATDDFLNIIFFILYNMFVLKPV